MKNSVWMQAALLILLAPMAEATLDDPAVTGPTLRVGLNGAACAFANVTEAIAAAQSGDDILIEVGTYNERLGPVIGKNLSLLASESGSDCTKPELFPGDSAVIDGSGFTDFIGTGGILDIRGASVSLFQVNLTNGTTGQGGLVTVQDGTFTTLGSSLSNGTASSDLVNAAIEFDTDEPAGGCVYAENSTVSFQETQFNNCRVIGPNDGQDPTDGDGGAIHARLGSSVDGFFLVAFSDNAARNGGAISLVDSTADLAEIGFSNNAATGNGGAVYVETSELVLGFNSSFTDNSSGEGGALYAQNGTIDITDSAFFIDNSAAIGGAIALVQANLAVRRSSFGGPRTRFEGNSATQFSGAIDMFGSGAAPGRGSGNLIDSVDFINNTSGVQGGAVGLVAADEVEIIDSVFDGNSSVEGGAIYQESSSSTIRASTTCRAFEFADQDRYCSEFRNNSSSATGAAIHYRSTGGGNVLTTSFVANQGPNAVALFNTTSVTMESVWLHDNQGAAIRANNQSLFEAIHVTMTANNLGFNGVDDSSLFMYNSIVWGNFPDGGVNLGAGAVGAGCNFDQSGQVGDATDPVLATNIFGQAHLGIGSPAIDACPEENIWPVDLEGRTRVMNGAPDAGAFEVLFDAIFNDRFGGF